MGEEDRVSVVPPRLEQLNGIILLGCTVGTVFFVGSVKGIDLATEHGAFEGAASLAHFFGRRLPRDRKAVLPLEGDWEFRVRQEHRFELLIGESRNTFAYISLMVILLL